MSESGQDEGRTVGAVDTDAAARRSLVHHDIEVILARQLAGYLALPIVIVDPGGTVIFYNEPAERILGRRFDESGPIPPTHWGEAFEFVDESGTSVPAEKMPLATALRTRRLVQLNYRMRGLDGSHHHIAELGIPLLGNAGRFLGVLAVLFELDD
jgi:PAS domain-containing protein